MVNPADIEMPFRGRTLTVWYAETERGKRPARDYLQGLARVERAKFYGLIETLANMGEIINPTHFKWLDRPVAELKISGRRLLCFEHAGDWYLTHGCDKVKKKQFQLEIARAQRIREEYLRRRTATGEAKDKGST